MPNKLEFGGPPSWIRNPWDDWRRHHESLRENWPPIHWTCMEYEPNKYMSANSANGRGKRNPIPEATSLAWLRVIAQKIASLAVLWSWPIKLVVTMILNPGFVKLANKAGGYYDSQPRFWPIKLVVTMILMREDSNRPIFHLCAKAKVSTFLL